MGQRISHMNISAIRSIIKADNLDVENILRKCEGKEIIKRELSKKGKVFTVEPKLKEHVAEEDSFIPVDENSTFEEPFNFDDNNEGSIDKFNDSFIGNAGQSTVITIGEESFAGIGHVQTTEVVNGEKEERIDEKVYDITRTYLTEIMTEIDMIVSDQDIMINVFILIDTRGYDRVDIRDVLISFTMFTATSLKDCIEIAFAMYDRNKDLIMDKKYVIHIFRLLNEMCLYFDDRSLPRKQIDDLTDSVFTNAGKIDGDICYLDHFNFIIEHPIVEMFLSIQWQGPVKDKVLDEQELKVANLSVNPY